MIDAECLDTGASSDLQAGSVGAIRNYDGDNRIQSPVADGVDAPSINDTSTTTFHSRFT